MSLELPIHFIPLAALYPEIHYRLKYLPLSRYFRREPEIIIDAPCRLEPGARLPLLITVKDADRFPVKLLELKVEARNSRRTFNWSVSFPDSIIKRHWWWQIEEIDLPDESPCRWVIDATLNIRLGGRDRQVTIDNIPGLSQSPLEVIQSGEPLPRRNGWIYGDFHVHTHYTEDQIEFGGPLGAYPVMGKALGLAFTLPGDHSYDLDDLPGSFHHSDPELQRFHMRNAEIDRYNHEQSGQFCVIPGYELTVGNAQGRNVHLLLANQKSFLPGSGDSAEAFFRNSPELSIPRALANCDEGCLPIVAHPLAKPTFWEKFLLRRGFWEAADLENPDLNVLQIWNGHEGRAFREGLAVWIEGLLQGRQWRIIGGSDAHGFFNRARQVTTPMWKISESDQHIFGKIRTGLLLRKELTTDNLLEAVQNSRSFVTNGPFLDLNYDPQGEIQLDCISAAEFGKIDGVKIFWGAEGLLEEELIAELNSPDAYKIEKRIPVGKTRGYYRAETKTSMGLEAHTNPLFLTASV